VALVQLPQKLTRKGFDMGWFAIVSLIIEILKLLVSLRKKNPVLVKAVSVELKAAEKSKRIDKLQEILAKLKDASAK